MPDARDQGAAQPAVDQVAARLANPLREPAPVSRTVVATADQVVFDETSPIRATQPSALWGPLPDVNRWLTHEDGAVAFVLALVDHEGGDITTYRGFDAPAHEMSAGGDTHHEHKTRGGGLAHKRYQRTAENVWRDNADDVLDVLGSVVADGYRLVILAGEPETRARVREGIGGQAEVAELDHGGPARDRGDQALYDAVSDVLAQHAVAHRLDATHELKDRLGRGRGVAVGVDDVADAFVRGQVATLLFDPRDAADLEVHVAAHPGLPVGDVGSTARADLAFVAAACHTGADVIVAPSSTLAGTPVAALLRWEQ